MALRKSKQKLSSGDPGCLYTHFQECQSEVFPHILSPVAVLTMKLLSSLVLRVQGSVVTLTVINRQLLTVIKVLGHWPGRWFWSDSGIVISNLSSGYHECLYNFVVDNKQVNVSLIHLNRLLVKLKGNCATFYRYPLINYENTDRKITASPPSFTCRTTWCNT